METWIMLSALGEHELLNKHEIKKTQHIRLFQPAELQKSILNKR